MSVAASASKSNHVFHQTPTSVIIDEDSVTNYARSNKIDTLINELMEKGVLVAVGIYGPDTYVDAPLKLKDQDVYYWKPNTERVKSAQQSSWFVLRGQKKDGKEYVYLAKSQDVTENTKSFIRTHKPSSTDKKTYIISHENFFRNLVDLYPPSPLSLKANPTASKSDEKKADAPSKKTSRQLDDEIDWECARKLISMPLDSIIDRGDGEKACKALGQGVFDAFKKKYGNSPAGREALYRVHKKVGDSAPDGSIRKQYIERAWDSVGDDVWRWLG